MINYSSEKIETIIETALAACQSWTQKSADNGLQLIDPIDGRVIYDQYGDSHLAASLIILSNLWSRPELHDQGRSMLRELLRKWTHRVTTPHFHADFNNFALCLAAEALGEEDDALTREVIDVVLSSSDSRHHTVNWLPMRVYVNLCKYEWSHNAIFLATAKDLLSKVEKSTNADGGIEDRLFYGLSYNSQYNISSLATLMLIAKRWPNLDLKLEKKIAYVNTLPLPDGDINYMGRGTNQIFAWGPWFYVCSAQKSQKGLKAGLKYVTSKYEVTAKHENILLNTFDGADKSFWWDYHYCSVYHAHFLLWSVLALRDASTYQTRPNSAHTAGKATGLELKENGAGGVRIFKGRALYPAEYGPSICAVWLKEIGILYKGGLGPWQGMFGSKYAMGSIQFQNYFGIMQENDPKRIFSMRSVTRILKWLFRNPTEKLLMHIMPVFSEVKVALQLDALEITFEAVNQEAYINIPIFEDKAPSVDLAVWVDGVPVEILKASTIRNQYGWVQVWRSRTVVGANWTVSLRPKSKS